MRNKVYILILAAAFCLVSTSCRQKVYVVDRDYPAAYNQGHHKPHKVKPNKKHKPKKHNGHDHRDNGRRYSNSYSDND